MSNKYCIVYFLVLLFVNVSICLQSGPVPFSARRADLIESQSCERSGWSCKDCSTLQSCGPDNVFKFQISCGDQFPDRPYCDPSVGRCVSDRHVCAEMKDPEFICPDAGIYPDLTDCRRYISCRAKGEVGLIYSCLFQSVYNPMAKKCITNSYCYDPMVDCNGEYKTMAYSLDRSMYIVCRGEQKPLMKDCGNKMLQYDPSLLACDFKCKEEGRFAHPTNNSLFYICVYNDKEIVRMMGLCREGTIYDEMYDTCVHDFDLITTTQLMKVTTELATELEKNTDKEILERTTDFVSETIVDNNDQNLEITTAANEDQNSEANIENIEVTTSETTLNEEQILQSTTDNRIEDKTTIDDQEFETTSEDAFSNATTDNGQNTSIEGVVEEITTQENPITEDDTTSNDLESSGTTDNGQNTSTEGVVEEITTQENSITEDDTSSNDLEQSGTTDNGQITSTEGVVEEITTNENPITENDTTSNDLEQSDTTFTTDNIEDDLTTISNAENVTHSSEESLETREKSDTHEEIGVSKETDDTKENITNEDTDETKEEEKTDSNEQTKETEEIHSEEDEDNKSSQKSEESNSHSEEANKTKEKSNDLKDKKRKCIGRICLPNWKIPGFLKRKNSNN